MLRWIWRSVCRQFGHCLLLTMIVCICIPSMSYMRTADIVHVSIYTQWLLVYNRAVWLLFESNCFQAAAVRSLRAVEATSITRRSRSQRAFACWSLQGHSVSSLTSTATLSCTPCNAMWHAGANGSIYRLIYQSLLTVQHNQPTNQVPIRDSKPRVLPSLPQCAQHRLLAIVAIGSSACSGPKSRH
jgi:hypothetical protein